VFSRLTEVQVVAWGGYPQAERQRLAIAREEVPQSKEMLKWRRWKLPVILFDTATHRDFWARCWELELSAIKLATLSCWGTGSAGNRRQSWWNFWR